MHEVLGRRVAQPVAHPLHLGPRHRRRAPRPVIVSVRVDDAACASAAAVEPVLVPRRVVEEAHAQRHPQPELCEERQVGDRGVEGLGVARAHPQRPVVLAARHHVSAYHKVEVRRRVLVDDVYCRRPPRADDELVLQRALPVVPRRAAREWEVHERRVRPAEEVAVLRREVVLVRVEDGPCHLSRASRAERSPVYPTHGHYATTARTHFRGTWTLGEETQCSSGPCRHSRRRAGTGLFARHSTASKNLTGCRCGYRQPDQMKTPGFLFGTKLLRLRHVALVAGRAGCDERPRKTIVADAGLV